MICQSRLMTTKKLLRVTVLWPAILACMASAIAALQGAGGNLTLFYLYWQDRWLLLAAALLLASCTWRLAVRSRPLSGDGRWAPRIGAMMAAAAFAGHYMILSGHDLSRDEQMATFDAAIFARGQLVAPLTGIWRDHAEALNTMFMYPMGESAAWISTYLPLNAALRAFFGLLGDPALTGPATVLAGAVALWGCARRIWPDNRETAIVALFLYAGSGQILFNGMTAYAMPAHLALNLCWLWLFLRRVMWGDAAALAVGFVAVGLHQPVMHPLFVAPILFLLVLERDWRRAALYFVGYAAIGAFWAWWPSAMYSLVAGNALAPKSEGVDYVSRLVATIADSDGMRIANMVANILRFFSWQHLLLLPLLPFGIAVARRDRLAGALVGGILLAVAVMLVILPYQGHGFGYRYLHGLIGSFILLAAYGWTTLGEAKAIWRGLLLRTTVADLIVVLPLQAWMAHSFYVAPAQVSKRIAGSAADYVVVGGADAPFAADLVVNPPFLDKQPIRLLREAIDPALVRALCASRPRVALLEPNDLAPIVAYYRMSKPVADAPHRALAGDLRAAGCTVVPIG